LIFVACVTAHAIAAEPLSDRKVFPPSDSLSCPNRWKSLGARSGELMGGCGTHRKRRCSMVSAAAQAVWGGELLYCKRTPLLRSPRHFDLIAGRMASFQACSLRLTLMVVSLGFISSNNS
jgi:hypothetical protein